MTQPHLTYCAAGDLQALLYYSERLITNQRLSSHHSVIAIP